MKKYRGDMSDAGLPGEREFLKSACRRSPAEIFNEVRKTVSAMVDTPIIKTSDSLCDSMGETGLAAPLGSLGGIEIPNFRPVRKAVGGATIPTGLEKLEAPQRFSLLKSGSHDRDVDEPARHYQPGQKLRHIDSGAHCTFIRHDGNGGVVVAYDDDGTDTATHEPWELESVGSSKGKSTGSEFTKGGSNFSVGDSVTLQDGQRGKIAELGAGGLMAIVRTATGSTMSLTKHLRLSALDGESDDLRFIPHSAPKAASTSLLKGTRPFQPAAAACGVDFDLMQDTGL